MKKKNIIYDGDMGGDDLWAIALLLANRQRFDIAGISTVFGNVSLPQATKVTLGFLERLKVRDIEVMEGCGIARDNINPLGDNAFGEDGVGGVIFPETSMKAKQGDIADMLMEKLNSRKDPFTIIATGPLTNIAHLLNKYPEAKDKIEEIIWMGGADRPPGAKGCPVLVDGKIRRGNITLNAEFNAYMDPQAVNEVIRSGANLTIMSADATQQMILTPKRQKVIEALHPSYGPELLKMAMVVADLDKMKFGVNGPFIHDSNAVLYALRKSLYEKREGVSLRFEEAAPSDEHGLRGMVTMGAEKGNVTWVNGVKDKSSAFGLLSTGLGRAIYRAAEFRIT